MAKWVLNISIDIVIVCIILMVLIFVCSSESTRCVLMCSPVLGMVLLEPWEWSLSRQLESSCHPTEHFYIYILLRTGTIMEYWIMDRCFVFKWNQVESWHFEVYQSSGCFTPYIRELLDHGNFHVVIVIDMFNNRHHQQNHCYGHGIITWTFYPLQDQIILCLSLSRTFMYSV